MVAIRDNYEVYDGPPRHIRHDSLLGDEPINFELWRPLAELMTGGTVDLELPQYNQTQSSGSSPASYVKKIHYNQE